jgi:hypothetical protein
VVSQHRNVCTDKMELVTVINLVVTPQNRARQVSDNPMSLTDKTVKGLERNKTLHHFALHFLAKTYRR